MTPAELKARLVDDLAASGKRFAPLHRETDCCLFVAAGCQPLNEDDGGRQICSVDAIMRRYGITGSQAGDVIRGFDGGLLFVEPEYHAVGASFRSHPNCVLVQQGGHR